MEATRALTNPLKAATFETLIGLLACTGLRAGEAMRLDRGDFDAEQALLTVRNSKFNKSRQVLLHSTTVHALRRYGHLPATSSARFPTNAGVVLVEHRAAPRPSRAPAHFRRPARP